MHTFRWLQIAWHDVCGHYFPCMHTHTHAEVEVGLDLLRGTVLEGEGGARVNVTVLQGSLGGDSLSFIVSTVNGSAQGTAIKHCDSECEQFTTRSVFYLNTKISIRL